jgi:hypothetical protein
MSVDGTTEAISPAVTFFTSLEGKSEPQARDGSLGQPDFASRIIRRVSDHGLARLSQKRRLVKSYTYADKFGSTLELELRKKHTVLKR